MVDSCKVLDHLQKCDMDLLSKEGFSRPMRSRTQATASVTTHLEDDDQSAEVRSISLSLAGLWDVYC